MAERSLKNVALYHAVTEAGRSKATSPPRVVVEETTSPDDVIMSGESFAQHTQTHNFTSKGDSPVIQSSVVPSRLQRETPSSEEDDKPSTRRMIRAIDSASANTQILVDIKENILESSDRPADDRLETNEVDVVGREEDYYKRIHPTKTIVAVQGKDTEQVLTTSIDRPGSGEGDGAPRGRSLSLTGPETGKDTAAATNVSASRVEQATERPVLPSESFRSHHDQRKTNPDIQDIITGIVKLLNGNVKVQTNPSLPPGVGGRPLRPLSTRINNRGPPRITDLPELPPDFNSPVLPPHPAVVPMPPPPPPPLQTTRVPPPYPFDLPPGIVPLPPQPTQGNSPSSHPFMTGVPLPEQMVPVNPGGFSNRPMGGQNFGGRPTRPRPTRPRPTGQHQNPNRRPLPGQPIGPDMPVSKPGIMKKPTVDDLKETTSFFDENEYGSVMSTNNRNNMTEIGDLSTELRPPSKKIPTTTEDAESNVKEDEVTTTNEQNNSSDPEKEKKPPVMETEKSDEAPKIIATLTSSASTVTEATKATLPEEIETLSEEPVLLEPSTGVGVAVPVLESSMMEVATSEVTAGVSSMDTQSSTAVSTPPITKVPIRGTPPDTQHTQLQPTIGGEDGFPYYPYRPRPGIVLDDTEYKPGVGLNRPIITAPSGGYPGEAFDITVSAIQGPGGNTGQPFVYPVEIEGVKLSDSDNGEISVITAPKEGQHFVSIDGKRTYFNLFGSSTEEGLVTPSKVQPAAGMKNPPPSAIGTGFAVAQPVLPATPPVHNPSAPPRRRPSHPPVRIDTCIVGDDSTCDAAQNEMCRTEVGVSSCHCRPSYSRRKHREPCRRVVSILMSLRVDRLYDRKLVWDNHLLDSESEQYQQLSWEAGRAVDSAMSMTPYSDDFLGVKVNSVYTNAAGPGGSVFVNITLQLEESGETLRPAIRHDIQRHLLGVIHRRNNNIGNSALWVDSPPGSVSNLQDVDECSNKELHDCHEQATCNNVFGSFRCTCSDGYKDPWAGNPHRSGRQCDTCSPEHCNSRGECRYEDGHQVCHCVGNFYGSQCEVDGEVLGVAVGASVAAVVIIVLTLVCLCMWSRRWSREQKTAAGMGSPVFGYMATVGNTVKTPGVGAPPYQVSLEDRLRWAQIADVMAQANHYAQPEPISAPTRPSSAVFGYPNLNGTLPHLGPPPVPLPRLGLAHHAMNIHGMSTINTHRGRTPDRTVDSTSSEEEDKADLLGRNFHVPRPKSRSSVANQSGIYYDVDYDQGDYGATMKSQQAAIPMSTYAIGRSPYYRQ
uniref:EGF-like domain-containing protein n=1 Tax=Timema douglasi TaxID=61478 RepID=A0A7R8VLM8_TIMDO|nr:unnamed protein product [Timema douglasi]